MNNIYTIFSPGRTGSHIILEMLSGTPYIKGGLADAFGIWLPLNQTEYQQYVSNQNLVIKLHDIRLIRDLDPSTVTVIVSLRKDSFSQLMSLIVANNIVNEWSGRDYTGKTVEPIVVDKSILIKTLTRLRSWNYDWQNKINPSVYKKVITIYYEDLVEKGAEFLAKELDLEYTESKVGNVYQKSPYFYKDIILNWEELYQEYCKILQS